jgi:hypothetical protein
MFFSRTRMRATRLWIKQTEETTPKKDYNNTLTQDKANNYKTLLQQP